MLTTLIVAGALAGAAAQLRLGYSVQLDPTEDADPCIVSRVEITPGESCGARLSASNLLVLRHRQLLSAAKWQAWTSLPNR